jgi:hypothetical protein
VERLAAALLAYETVTGPEVVKILAGVSVADLRPEPAPEARVPGATTPASEKGEGRSKGEEIGDLPGGSPGFSPA